MGPFKMCSSLLSCVSSDRLYFSIQQQVKQWNAWGISGLGLFPLVGYLDASLAENLSENLSNKQESKTLQPSLKGFERQHTEGASAVSSCLAGNNNASVMGILLTSCFV